ncbi:MAG: hypothetical protein ABIP97_02660 [Chthoniobacterales bacterium]
MSPSLRLILTAAIALTLPSCSPDLEKRYDKPMTYEQAKKVVGDFPLPDSCRNVTYGIYADWQAYTCLVRFEAPVDVCIKQIDTVLAWDNQVYKRDKSYGREEIGKTVQGDTSTGWLKEVPWFKPGTIKRGIYTGENSSHIPQIWVDTEKGVFYYKEED